MTLRPWRRRVAAAVATVFAVGSIAPAMAQATSKPPAKAAAAPAVRRIPEADVQQLLKVGTQRSFLGIHKHDGDTLLLSITSARQSIAFASNSAASKGGRYVPPPDARADVVFVSCGDEDLGERWDCVRLAVTNASGRRVTPLKYSAAPRVYRNALGASWTATTTTALYRLADLAEGFSVEYAGADGTELTEEVTPEEVRDDLLSVVPLTEAERMMTEAKRAAEEKAVRDAEPNPPDFLLGTLAPADDTRWTVTSLNPGYTWRSCVFAVGINTVPLGPLAPGAAVTASRPLGGVATDPPIVRCEAKGKKFEGPVPAEFAVAIERRGPASWHVSNLTDWGWSYCEAAFGGARATLVFLPRRGSAVFSGAEFSPPVDASEKDEDLKFSCVTGGKRIEAVRRPKP
jgi:hypothetical protein